MQMGAFLGQNTRSGFKHLYLYTNSPQILTRKNKNLIKILKCLFFTFFFDFKRKI